MKDSEECSIECPLFQNIKLKSIVGELLSAISFEFKISTYGWDATKLFDTTQF